MTKEREAVARAIADRCGTGFTGLVTYDDEAAAAIAAMKPLLMDVTPEMENAGLQSWFSEMPPIEEIEVLGGYQGMPIAEMREGMRGLIVAVIHASPLFKEPANNG